MLNQAAEDRDILAKRLGISPDELRFVTRAGEGQGLIFYGSLIIPFADHFPKDTMMYRAMTTKLYEAEETGDNWKEPQKGQERGVEDALEKQEGGVDSVPGKEETWAEGMTEEDLFEAVGKLLSAGNPVWRGSATELSARVSGGRIPPHVLSRRLSAGASRLYSDYGIRYERMKTHKGRSIRLSLEAEGNDPDRQNGRGGE